ncbi:MAG: MBL fold metallo-hydrolase [Clostridia bacterium]|nr:MBL fold metallo-hydrolase [Clostridia bacterium]
MKVHYFGTTTLMFDDGKDQLLFDCHVTRPSLIKYIFGNISADHSVADRVIRDFSIDRLRGIFISHSHHDHVLDAPYFANKCGADVYGSASALNVARGGNVPEERLHCFGDRMEYTSGDFSVTVLPSVHSLPTVLNNDLGQTIDEPLMLPAKRGAFKEGGSFDFLVEHTGRKYLIRPSYNYLEGQLRGIKADVLFLGITGLSKDTEERRLKFFAETLDTVRPETVIPVHWDNFFAPLYQSASGMPRLIENTPGSMYILAKNCAERKIGLVVQLPLTGMEL